MLLLLALTVASDTPPVVFAPNARVSWDASREPAARIKPGWKAPTTGLSMRLSAIVQLLDGARVSRFVIESFEGPRQSAAEAVDRLQNADLDLPATTIGWAEGHRWPIRARVELSNGKTARLVTDGSHTCYENVQGFRWFFRRSPH